MLENAGKKRIFFIKSGSLREHLIPELLTDHQEIFKDQNGKLYEDSIYISEVSTGQLFSSCPACRTSPAERTGQERRAGRPHVLYSSLIYIFCADMIKHGQWAIDYLHLHFLNMENDDQMI